MSRISMMASAFAIEILAVPVSSLAQSGGSAGVAASGPSATTGTANSSEPSMTTGSAGSRAAGGGTGPTGPRASSDVAIDREDKAIDRRLRSICRGC